MNDTPPIQPAAAESAAESFDFSRQIPTQYRILGLALKPLSIGRYRRLAAHKCAFVSELTASAELSDLILGVICCSMACVEFDSFSTSPDFEQEVSAWARRVIPSPSLGRLAEKWPIKPFRWLYSVWSESPLGERWRRRHMINIAEKFQLFRQYIADAQEMPRYCQKQAQDIVSTAHWSDNIEMTLRNQLGWSGNEIDEQPLSKALTDYLNWAAANDLVVIFSEEEIEEAKRNTAVIEKIMAGREGVAWA